jgi:hypothetical protein
MADGRWRETIDLVFEDEQAEAEFSSLLLPEGAGSTVRFYPPDAFEPVMDQTRTG